MGAGRVLPVGRDVSLDSERLVDRTGLSTVGGLFAAFNLGIFLSVTAGGLAGGISAGFFAVVLSDGFFSAVFKGGRLAAAAAGFSLLVLFADGLLIGGLTVFFVATSFFGVITVSFGTVVGLK